MKKIMLIEDDADLYALLKYNLEKEGFQMVGAQTGKGATSLLFDRRIKHGGHFGIVGITQLYVKRV